MQKVNKLLDHLLQVYESNVYSKYAIQSYFQSLYRIKLVILNLEGIIMFHVLQHILLVEWKWR